MSINVCNDRSMASITSLPSGVSGSSLVLLETQTASSSATLSFTSNIDSTYKEYQFHFIDIHPSADAQFTFQAILELILVTIKLLHLLLLMHITMKMMEQLNLHIMQIKI